MRHAHKCEGTPQGALNTTTAPHTISAGLTDHTKHSQQPAQFGPTHFTRPTFQPLTRAGKQHRLVPPRKRESARSSLNSYLHPRFRTPMLLLSTAPLDPVARPVSGLDQPPDSPQGLIWARSVSYYGPNNAGWDFFSFFLNTTTCS